MNKVQITLVLAEPLYRLLAAGLRHGLESRIESEIGSVSSQLGVDAEIQCALEQAPEGSPQPAICLKVRRVSFPCPAFVALRALSYVLRIHASADLQSHLNRWMSGEVDGTHEELVTWLGVCSAALIKSQPDALLGPDHGGDPLCDARRFLLRQGICLRGMPAQVLSTGDVDENNEKLAELLHPPTVQIVVNERYLDEITQQADDMNVFGSVRDDMVEQLGLTRPNLEFSTSDKIAPRCFAFRINHLDTMPWYGLAPDERMMEAGPADVQRDQKVLIAPDGSNCVVVKSAEVTNSKRAIWTPLGYMALALKSELTANAGRLVTQSLTEGALDGVNREDPVLASAIRNRFSSARLTRIIRALVDEGVFIRDFRTMLTALLEFDAVPSDLHYILLDDRLPSRHAAADRANPPVSSLVEFIRMQLKRSITATHLRGQSELSVYLVRADLEFALFGVVEQRRSEGLQSIEVSMNFGENQIRNFLEHVRSTYAAHKPFAPKPPIMTTAEVRPGLREVIRSEFPDIPVIAYQELLPDTNVNSLAKLGD